MNMKKKLLALTLASSVVACGSAMAFDPKFYLGGELDWNSPQYKTLTTNVGTGGATPKKNRFGIGLFAGLKFNECFAAEVGYNWMARSNTNDPAGNNVRTTLYNIYLDGLGFLAVSPEVDLIGSIGVGYLKPGVSITNSAVEVITTANPNQGKAGIRVGAGGQYKFDENLAARLMVRYQTANSNLIRNNFSAGLGIVWYM